MGDSEKSSGQSRMLNRNHMGKSSDHLKPELSFSPPFSLLKEPSLLREDTIMYIEGRKC